ncbi:MAG: hypothetical protein IT428_11945 [Planctomycetaceae bacterium]|nr:hypothetical protein [Planctomycetaceae bacterium]
MPPRKSAPVEPVEVAELRTEIGDLRTELADLKQSIGVLVDVMDGIREELQWLSRNGLPPHEERLPPSPVLKQMAADPCDPNWGDKLVIARGFPEERRSVPELDPVPPHSILPETAPLPSFEPGNAVLFDYDGREEFGEIVSIDHARAEAVVMLIPSQEEVIVPLDYLTEVDPDPDDEPETGAADREERPQSIPPAAQPPSGKLFAVPGDQKRLF